MQTSQNVPSWKALDVPSSTLLENNAPRSPLFSAQVLTAYLKEAEQAHEIHIREIQAEGYRKIRSEMDRREMDRDVNRPDPVMTLRDMFREHNANIQAENDRWAEWYGAYLAPRLSASASAAMWTPAPTPDVPPFAPVTESEQKRREWSDMTASYIPGHEPRCVECGATGETMRHVLRWTSFTQCCDQTDPHNPKAAIHTIDQRLACPDKAVYPSDYGVESLNDILDDGSNGDAGTLTDKRRSVDTFASEEMQDRASRRDGDNLRSGIGAEDRQREMSGTTDIDA